MFIVTEYAALRSFLQQRFRNRTYFQIQDLRHPDDTSIRVTADDVNFVTNPKYEYCM